MIDLGCLSVRKKDARPTLPAWLVLSVFLVGAGFGYYLLYDSTRTVIGSVLLSLPIGGSIAVGVSWIWYIVKVARGKQ